MIAKITGVSPNTHDFFAVEAGGLRVRLQRGHQSTICIPDGHRTINISYNRRFRGLTGAQRPDIVVEVVHDGWPEIIVVFDAKYRVDASSEYLQTFVHPGPPIDAINALHRYRDAIVLGPPNSPRGRPVVKGVALFPLPATLVPAFVREHQLYAALGVLGIGALPFLPDITSSVECWLHTLLDATPDELADSGPKWLALEHARGA